ncbi:putative hydro-lyase [Enterovirga rhinocerotis]|uniref:Putative hydro-lyase EV668_3632 n=1 Tax=Enterovirga rhinocerotis TaxID=1339210 RepID=A0A4R7BTR4_9HYPH|nr:putative hydro-lyase [Enterovirga rhinocerotis]TDR89144.1 uncharacterized protein YcsI (UPF0317 family) [Enterovirga rhinocerotis]
MARSNALRQPSAAPQDVSNPLGARLAIREGSHTGPTAGMAPGCVQGNLVILPKYDAADFLRFAVANPKPCPIIAVSEPGDPHLAAIGSDLDIRTDVPRYVVWKDGRKTEEPADITPHWRDDLVTFVIGCSYSFEQALIEDGIEIRHITEGCAVPMYRTSIPTTPAGPFHGPLVVSMRPMTPANAIRAVQITGRLPGVHGAPVHLGRPDLIGIADLAKPDYGDAVSIRDDEIPVFWACGVTPQSVIATSRPRFCITHYPGSMIVTDLSNARLSVS